MKMSKRMFLLFTILFVSTVPAPPTEYFPLHPSRIQQVLKDESLLKHVGLYYSRLSQKSFPICKLYYLEGPDGSAQTLCLTSAHTELYYLNTSPNIVVSGGKMYGGGSTQVDIPKADILRKANAILQVFLSIPMENICAVGPGKLTSDKEKQQEWEQIQIVFTRPKEMMINPKRWGLEVEACTLIIEPDTQETAKDLREAFQKLKAIFEREFIQFAMVAIEKYPSKKVIDDPDDPQYFHLEIHLTDKDVKKVEQEVEARLKAQQEESSQPPPTSPTPLQ